jgi:ribosomal peptide maturation radical SAM protein 1
MHRVQMICMPYQIAAVSSLSTALLSTILRQGGVEVSESYLHFEFARQIGNDLYYQITAGDTSRGLLGELFFAEAIHGRSDNPELAATFGPFEARERLRQEFLDYCLAFFELHQPTLVGFTTSFNQLLPSLWLGRQIKQRWPQTRVVLGGSACTGSMGPALCQAYPFVDCIVSGNGDRVLLELATGNLPFPDSSLLTDEEPVDLNLLPIPEYQSFLAEAAQHDRARDNLMLSYETSRGCWWGEKHHCTFCGINGAQMRFSAKTPERAYREIRELWERYRLHLFSTDSILAIEHLKRCLPRLAADHDRPFLFYEIKANLRLADVKLLYDANVRHIQPGIESLSSHVLDLLRKGVRMIQNLALLKWCREWNIRVSWNLLYGIPGETLDDYESQLALMARIPHFIPPTSMSRVRLDRFSPYFMYFSDYGWSGVQPLDLYFELHRGIPEDLISGMAYHFDGLGGTLDVPSYERRLYGAMGAWSERHKQGDGLFWDDSVGLFEVRNGDVLGYEQSDTLTELVRLTNVPIGFDRLCASIDLSEADWAALFDDGVLVREGNLVLNLAVCLDRRAEVDSQAEEQVESAFRILAEK